MSANIQFIQMSTLNPAGTCKQFSFTVWWHLLHLNTRLNWRMIKSKSSNEWKTMILTYYYMFATICAKHWGITTMLTVWIYSHYYYCIDYNKGPYSKILSWSSATDVPLVNAQNIHFLQKNVTITSHKKYIMTTRQNSPSGHCKSQLQQIPLPIFKPRLYLKICFLVNPPFHQVVASSACQLQYRRLKQTRQQMIALHKYKHKLTWIIIQCTLNGQYFVFIRKIKFDLISIKVIGNIFSITTFTKLLCS